jgi:hypothetical protein
VVDTVVADAFMDGDHSNAVTAPLVDEDGARLLVGLAGAGRVLGLALDSVPRQDVSPDFVSIFE